MTALLRILKTFDRGLAAVELVVAILSLVAMLVLTTLPIAFRLVQGSSVAVAWAMPAALLLLLTSTFLGASLALRSRRHIQIDLVTRGLPRRGKAGFGVLSGLIAAAILGLLFAAAVHYVQVNWQQTSKLRWLALGPATLAMPVALGVMAFRSLLAALEDLRGVVTGELDYMVAYEHHEGADLMAAQAAAKEPSKTPGSGIGTGTTKTEGGES